ncbi:glycoside hydrolase family 28 protein [Telluria mixta]|uniref:Glycoside hydrolase family 28 protein n=1 Tax=Telluria mixta TaxID=34071 RepID=A0ABT2C0U9_9BURK|nr:glycoside hydrolase family 28 protein [Telluria mixta]MCS0630289.1 glycoside hydrolase family 28 protein [Telluria mixta]WEM94401.1 glycoside hydrolase family 28 protein [Telluria mixta]
MKQSFDARRGFLKTAAIAGLALSGPARTLAAAGDPWQAAASIARRLANPVKFRKADYVVTDFGAAPCKLVPVKAWVSFEDQADLPTPAPGSKDCYAAIRAAIEKCHAEGGGRVVIPKGDWYCAGPIVLLSNVNVHLASGAHVYFSNDPADYAKYGDVDCGPNGKLVVSRWQSNDCLNFSAMIYAHNQDNIALTGDDWTAILDGQGGVPFPGRADCWWTWKGKNATINSVAQDKSPNYVPGKLAQNQVNELNPKSLADVAPGLPEEKRRLIQGEGDKWRADDAYLPALSEAGVPLAKRVFGLGHYLRPPMIQLIGCTNVLLEGYQVIHTPFWQHHPVACRNLTIRKVHANSLGPNSDGFDPEACDTVLVEGCQFNTGDDCIAIKAGKNLDTQYGPSQNIVIQNCTMQSGHGAVTLGSEMAGGIQNVYAQDLVFENMNWATNPLNTAIRLKTNMNRGGFLRNFYVRNVSIPNGVQTSPSFYASLPGSPIASRTVATAAGAVVTFDCDYTPRADNVRVRPPEVRNVHISKVKVGNVKTKDGSLASCFQAFVVLGPVASDYNGPSPAPAVLPVRDVTITDCDFGTPVNAAQPWYTYNVRGLKLANVKIGGKRYDTTLSA